MLPTGVIWLTVSILNIFLLENKYMYVIAYSIIRWIWNSAKCSVIGTETYNAPVLHSQDPLTGHKLGNAQNQWSIAIAVI